ncbi:MAG: trypsin-like peptidase domain-containing protein [Actinobacteria bacterium]|nr:trypsin-like peptidase domain-containing protein [Actinomycetota bacterium]
MVVGAVWLLTRPSAASLSDFDGTGSAQAASSLNVPSFPLRISQILASSTLRIVSLGCSSDTYGQGSGWPIAPHYVVTAAHVVAGRHEFAVQVPGGKTYLASVASFSPSADVAVLYVPGTRFAALSVANADASSSPVLAAGYPGGGPEQLVTSTLSGISTQTVPFPTLHSRLVVIFEAPSIGPGDSGGPVINSGGQVVGMMIDAGGGEVAAALPSQMWGPLASGIGQTSAVGTGACPS